MGLDMFTLSFSLDIELFYTPLSTIGSIKLNSKSGCDLKGMIYRNVVSVNIRPYKKIKYY